MAGVGQLNGGESARHSGYNPRVLALPPGTILHERYRILRPIGKGGMGAVYEASDCRLHHIVAVKQLTVNESEADSAFEREARLLAGLRHPGLPVVTDYFAGSDGRFLVMQ
jgi:serine/threonine protein kinase